MIPLLHRLPRPTFITLDRDFYRPDWAHSRYCLVWLDVSDDRAAESIRRFLRHASFNTQAKRLGIVARIHETGITYWRARQRTSQLLLWREK